MYIVCLSGDMDDRVIGMEPDKNGKMQDVSVVGDRSTPVLKRENAVSYVNRISGIKRLRRSDEPTLNVEAKQLKEVLRWVMQWLEVAVENNWSSYAIQRMQTNVMCAMKERVDRNIESSLDMMK